MTPSEARELIHLGVQQRGGTWLDLGAGSGVFTRALAALLGDEGHIYAIDQRSQLASSQTSEQATIEAVQANFSQPMPYHDLDGIVMANSLHYIRRQKNVLQHLVSTMKAEATLIIVEYDLWQPSPWIPFPLPAKRLYKLIQAVGLADIREIGRRSSRYGSRELYAVAARRG